MRRWLAALAALVLAPSQVMALTCALPPEPTRAQLETPAGAAEYRAATSVAVVTLKPALQPPCFWISFWRRFDDKAFPHDVCSDALRTRRQEMILVETLKGQPPARFPAILGGRYPADRTYVWNHRPEIYKASYRPQLRAPMAHGDFAFRHAGRVSNPSAAYAFGCIDETAPLLDSAPSWVVFRNAAGEITHWEPVARGHRDLLLERLRALKAGDAGGRSPIAPRSFFAGVGLIALYETKWCGDYTRIRPVGRQRFGPLDEVVDWRFPTAWKAPGVPACNPGQQYLVLGAGPLSNDWSDERAWPSIQLVPITNGAIRTANIVSQLKIEGPETIPVSQALAWTD